MPLPIMSLMRRLELAVTIKHKWKRQTNSEEVGVDTDEVLEEIPSPHVRSATKLDILPFAATIDLIMHFKLLQTIRLQHSLPHLN